jgi:hypothetical protein
LRIAVWTVMLVTHGRDPMQARQAG